MRAPRARKGRSIVEPAGTTVAKSLLALGALLFTCCAVGTGDNAIENIENRYRYVIPVDWISFGDELRAPGGTVVTIEVLSLVEAEETFLEELPESIVPELEDRTRRYFSVVGDEMRRDMTLGGRDALEVSYPIQVRSTDRKAVRSHIVVPWGDRLYVVQVTYPPGAPESDREGVQRLLDSWEFIEPEGAVEIQTTG